MGELVVKHLVIFGPTGDLSNRYLLPALAELHEAGSLPEGFRATGVHRRDWDAEQFRGFVREKLERHAADASPETRDWLVERAFDYRKADVSDGEKYALLASRDAVLGLDLEREATSGWTPTDEMQAMVSARDAARAAKDYGESDRLRDELAAMGLEVMDGPEGTTVRPQD